MYGKQVRHHGKNANFHSLKWNKVILPTLVQKHRSHNKAPTARCPTPRTPHVNVAARAGEPEASGLALFVARAPHPFTCPSTLTKGVKGVMP